MANPNSAAVGQRMEHTVFIDTSFDTHMAMVVGEADIVADFKKKIKDQHAATFPHIGEIAINALQVKHRGFMYHLSESMPVWTAFEGVKSTSIVYVDAFHQVKDCLDDDDHCRTLSDTKKRVKPEVYGRTCPDRQHGPKRKADGSEIQLPSESSGRLSPENQNPSDLSVLADKAHQVFHNCDAVTTSKSCKKATKLMKGSVQAVVSDDATNEITADKSQQVVPTTNEASCADPSSEALFEDISQKGNIEGSSKPDVTMEDNSVGDQESGRPDAIDALRVVPLSEVPFDSSRQSTNESDPTHFAMQEMEDVVPDHQNCAIDQAASVGRNELQPENAEKVSSESQKPADHEDIEPLVEASGHAIIANEDSIAPVKGKSKTEEAKLKKKSKDNQDGKKSQVESSQESLSMCYCDKEYFRVSESEAPQSSGSGTKHKLKSFHKRPKPCGYNDSEFSATHPPCASDAHKSKILCEQARLNNKNSKDLARHQLNDVAETFTASNSTFKSHIDMQLKKSKQLVTKKSSTAEVRKVENGSYRRKIMLSIDAFKDDTDESSEVDEAVGVTTPKTVGQRVAAEANIGSSEYTPEMLRKDFLIKKSKRTAQMTREAERQLDEIAPATR
ncbi:unnamed protein product [Rhodiola kirilowii]